MQSINNSIYVDLTDRSLLIFILLQPRLEDGLLGNDEISTQLLNEVPSRQSLIPYSSDKGMILMVFHFHSEEA